jgi:hypothetical protein
MFVLSLTRRISDCLDTPGCSVLPQRCALSLVPGAASRAQLLSIRAADLKPDHTGARVGASPARPTQALLPSIPASAVRVVAPGFDEKPHDDVSPRTPRRDRRMPKKPRRLPSVIIKRSLSDHDGRIVDGRRRSAGGGQVADDSMYRHGDGCRTMRMKVQIRNAWLVGIPGSAARAVTRTSRRRGK